jgi:heat shock protein HslJ
LKDRPAYSINGDRLTIKAKRGTVHLAAAPTLLPPTLDVPTFLGSKWQLTDVSDGQGTEHPVVGVPTLHALNGRLTLSDGCNTLSGPIAIEGQQVRLNGLATTEIGCSGVAASTAAAIDKIYGGPEVHEQVEGNRLTVKGDGTGALVYTWAPDNRGATDPTALANRAWILSSIAGVPARALASLLVDSHGPVSGTDGCGDLDGTAHVARGALTISGIPRQPSSSCTGAAGEQATTIDSILNQEPALWSVRDGKLLVYGGGAQAFALVYETGKPPPTFPSSTPDPATLVGPTWTLSSIETRSAGSNSAESSSDYGITLAFAKNGTFALHTKCSGSAGTVTVHGGTVQFTNVHRTGGNNCLSPQAEQSRKVLGGTVDWKIDNDGLHLTRGNTTLTFSS